MAAQVESRALRKGFVLGAIAGMGMMIWNAPQPGRQTREQILEALEGVFFTLLDAPEKLTGPREQPATKPPVASPTSTPLPPSPELATDVVIDGPRPSDLPR